MIELSVVLAGPRMWSIGFGWHTHEFDDSRVFDRADVLNIAFLFLKVRLYVYYASKDDE